MKKILSLLGLLALTTAAVIGINASAATMVTVTPGDPNGWISGVETPNGTTTLAAGPGTPPLGSGSLKFEVDSTGGVAMGTFAYRGVDLEDITKLEYSTYRQSGASALAPALQFDFDANGTDATTTWQGRLVYEPYFTNTVASSTWQTWNPLDSTGTGNWWFTNGTLAATCSQANPCTWNEVLTAFPDAAIRDAGVNTGTVLFKAGGGWTGGFVGNVDAFTIGVNGNDTTYNFEAVEADTTAPAVPIHLSPANNSTVTSAELTEIDWSDVTDPSSPVVYYFQSSNSSSTNPDGSFVSPAYTSGPLTQSEISTVGTPEGVYYWHVRAEDSAGNSSAWSSPWKVTVDNTPPPTPTPTATPTPTVTPTPTPDPEGPVTKDDCKNGGWRNFTNPSFKNQGQCVSSVSGNRAN